MPKGPLRISVGCHGHTQAHPEGTPELPQVGAGHPPFAKWGACCEAANELQSRGCIHGEFEPWCLLKSHERLPK